MKGRIRSIKGVDVGMTVPNTQNNHSAVGRFVESELKKYGHNYNDGKGIDLPTLRTENKTRKRKSKSAHTVGRMTTNDIVNTDWDNSSVKEKISAYQNTYEWDDTFCEITENSVYDFTDPDIQEKLKQGYELGRAEIVSGACGNNTKTYNGVIWQKDPGKEQWQYRITEKGMREIKSMARQKSFRKLFEVKKQDD